MTIKYQIIYWRDIPAQIKLKEGRRRQSALLADRFAVAIDEAAMRAGKTGAEDYLAQWRSSDWQERNGDMPDVAARLVAELSAAYPPERLRALIRQHGLEKEE